MRYLLCKIAFCGLLEAAALRAQYDTAAILGSVRDARGGAIADAAIKARNVDTGM